MSKPINIKNINKKYKYTNLLEKLERKTIKSKCSLNSNNINIRCKSSILTRKTKEKKKSFIYQNNSKKKLNHVGSFLASKYNGLKIKENINDNKLISPNSVTRSKSTGSFLNMNKNYKKPKSSKTRYNFEKNLLIMDNKDNNKYYKNKALNLLEGFPKTTMHKGLHYFMNEDNKNNF